MVPAPRAHVVDKHRLRKQSKRTIRGTAVPAAISHENVRSFLFFRTLEITSGSQDQRNRRAAVTRILHREQSLFQLIEERFVLRTSSDDSAFLAILEVDVKSVK